MGPPPAQTDPPELKKWRLEHMKSLRPTPPAKIENTEPQDDPESKSALPPSFFPSPKRGHGYVSNPGTIAVDTKDPNVDAARTPTVHQESIGRHLK
ncbi:hypothetical protein P7C73_g694, partial [Tremellales sp. Uapishka_1]